MDLASTNFEELDVLLDSLVDGGLTSVEQERLAGLLRCDLNARRQYVSFVTLHAHLEAEWGAQIPQMIRSERAGRNTDGERDELQSRNRSAIRPESPVRDPSLDSSIGDDRPFSQLPPAPTFVSATVPSAAGFFSSGWPLAYLIATIVFGVGLLVGALVHVSHPIELAEQMSIAEKACPPHKTTEQIVGRITGTVDCKWNDRKTEASSSVHVLLGRKYVLRSGLMEITYDTGAKVILQGPVTYEVQSNNGGFLEVGKLTGKVEAQRAKGFVVRTPTATVIDVGTEFGVEVDAKGVTEAHVLSGLVEVRPIAAGVREDQTIRLRQNESVRVENDRDRNPTIRRIAAGGDRFVHRLPEPKSVLLLKDTFDSQADSVAYGDAQQYGLNEELARRQSGAFRRVFYQRGDWNGAGSLPLDYVQVNHPLCPGKLSLLADYGQADWVVLNRFLPRDVAVSAELVPGAVHWPDKSRPEIYERNHQSANWIALGIRGRGVWFDHNVLPLATDAGAVIYIAADGNWGYFENGRRAASGNVPAKASYRLELSIVDNRLKANINGAPLALDASHSQGSRMLRGMASETSAGYLSLGVSNAVFLGGVNIGGGFEIEGRDMSTIDNLTVSTVGEARNTVNKSPESSDGKEVSPEE